MSTHTLDPGPAERRTIVYDSFAGRYSDSSRALYRWLRDRVPARHVWLADPAHHAAFPPEVETVPYGSPASVEVLEQADLVLANTHLEIEWTKRPGATYLQLWHGTPLKTVHRDVRWAPPGRLDWLDLDVARWDHLLSPSPASTPRLRSAFRWEGSVLETGYPRNDVLQPPRVDAVRARIRAQLGLAEHETVVLYAPTFRDRFFADPSAPPLELSLDLPRLAADLGPDVRLLTRVHYFMTDRLAPFDVPGVVDVSWYPDISELYAAADVLVTDYSSSMFDFAVTGKPLFFYAYDLPTYDVDRGFYFDLEPVSPGPVVTTQKALTKGLRDLDGVSRRYAKRYRRFRETYCALDDGHATERVGEFLQSQVLSPAGEVLSGA